MDGKINLGSSFGQRSSLQSREQAERRGIGVGGAAGLYPSDAEVKAFIDRLVNCSATHVRIDDSPKLRELVKEAMLLAHDDAFLLKSIKERVALVVEIVYRAMQRNCEVGKIKDEQTWVMGNSNLSRALNARVGICEDFGVLFAVLGLAANIYQNVRIYGHGTALFYKDRPNEDRLKDYYVVYPYMYYASSQDSIYGIMSCWDESEKFGGFSITTDKVSKNSIGNDSHMAKAVNVKLTEGAIRKLYSSKLD